MLRAAIFFALVAYASTFSVGDWPPLHGCNYNISQQANFQVPNASFHWYFDTVTARKPINGFKCFDWEGSFSGLDSNRSSVEFVETIVTRHQRVLLKCSGPDFADAPADFQLKCTINGRRRINMEFRVAETDYKTYAFLTRCVGPNRNGQNHESMGMLGPKKTGLDPAVRQRLTKRLTDAGWNANFIQRVPSQSGC